MPKEKLYGVVPQDYEPAFLICALWVRVVHRLAPFLLDAGDGAEIAAALGLDSPLKPHAAAQPFEPVERGDHVPLSHEQDADLEAQREQRLHVALYVVHLCRRGAGVGVEPYVVVAPTVGVESLLTVAALLLAALLVFRLLAQGPSYARLCPCSRRGGRMSAPSTADRRGRRRRSGPTGPFLGPP